MPISFSGISNNFSIYNANNSKKVQKTSVSFKGNDEVDKSEKQQDVPPSNYSTIQLHPYFAFNMQLLKDGYSKEEIDRLSMFQHVKVADIDFSNPNLLGDVLEGKITKDDIFSYSNKNLKDVRAMQLAYSALKEKFNTEDVQKHVADLYEIHLSAEEFFKSRGLDHTQLKPITHKTMILHLLHFVNKDNEPLLQALLNDETFNNIDIQNALIGTTISGDAKYGLEVLHMAQEVGYDKEFSGPLSVLIGEANENNIGMIMKMLGEQDTLIQNSDFVSNGLMAFLRDYSDLAIIYALDSDMTLADVIEIVKSEQEEYDE